MQFQELNEFLDFGQNWWSNLHCKLYHKYPRTATGPLSFRPIKSMLVVGMERDDGQVTTHSQYNHKYAVSWSPIAITLLEGGKDSTFNISPTFTRLFQNGSRSQIGPKIHHRRFPDWALYFLCFHQWPSTSREAGAFPSSNARRTRSIL